MSATAQPSVSDTPTRRMGRSERKVSHTRRSTAASDPKPMVDISQLACAAAASAYSGTPAATSRPPGTAASTRARVRSTAAVMREPSPSAKADTLLFHMRSTHSRPSPDSHIRPSRGRAEVSAARACHQSCHRPSGSAFQSVSCAPAGWYSFISAVPPSSSGVAFASHWRCAGVSSRSR